MNEWCKDFLGPQTFIVINNLTTKETCEMSFDEMKELMEKDGVEGVMRIASKIVFDKGFEKRMRDLNIRMGAK